MPVASFVLGARSWTPLDHKVGDDGPAPVPRWVPVGDLHALDPEAGTAVCTGEALSPDPTGRSFEPRGPGTCDDCSEALAPRGTKHPDR